MYVDQGNVVGLAGWSLLYLVYLVYLPTYNCLTLLVV